MRLILLLILFSFKSFGQIPTDILLPDDDATVLPLTKSDYSKAIKYVKTTVKDYNKKSKIIFTKDINKTKDSLKKQNLTFEYRESTFYGHNTDSTKLVLGNYDILFYPKHKPFVYYSIKKGGIFFTVYILTGYKYAF